MQQGLAGAVGLARHREPGLGEPVVDQAPDEVLGVANLVAGIGEVEEVVGGAVQVAEPVLQQDIAEHRTARAEDGPGGEVDHQIALAGEVVVGVLVAHHRRLAVVGRGGFEEGLARAPGVEHDQGGPGSVAGSHCGQGDDQQQRCGQGRRRPSGPDSSPHRKRGTKVRSPWRSITTVRPSRSPSRCDSRLFQMHAAPTTGNKNGITSMIRTRLRTTDRTRPTGPPSSPSTRMPAASFPTVAPNPASVRYR